MMAKIMPIICKVYRGQKSIDTEEEIALVAVPAVGHSTTLPDGTTHTVTQIIHSAAKGIEGNAGGETNSVAHEIASGGC
jgi:hypothetical protein